MNIKTNLIEEYVDYVDRSLRENANFVDTTTTQNKLYFNIIMVLIDIILSLFIVFLLFKYLNE